MSFLDRFDFAAGDLPPWVGSFVSITRPLAVSLTGMLIPVGAFTCGTVAGIFGLEAGLNMAKATSAFLKGIPSELYGLIGGVFLTYSVSKTAEVIKAPQPAGGNSPENPRPAPPAPVDEPPPEVDAAPRSQA